MVDAMGVGRERRGSSGAWRSTGADGASGAGKDGLAFGGVEFPPVARRKVAKPEGADADAQETEGGMTDGRGHAADLPILAFDEFEGQPASGNGFAVANRRVARR